MGAVTATLQNALFNRVSSPDRLGACEYTGSIYNKTENKSLCPSPGRPIIHLFGRSGPALAPQRSSQNFRSIAQ